MPEFSPFNPDFPGRHRSRREHQDHHLRYAQAFLNHFIPQLTGWNVDMVNPGGITAVMEIISQAIYEQIIFGAVTDKNHALFLNQEYSQ
jgi:hypothetical protein